MENTDQELLTILPYSGGTRIFERGMADLTERYRSNQRQNRLNDKALFPFIISSLNDPKERGGGASHPIHPHWIRPCPAILLLQILRNDGQ